ncbi:MAG: 3-deoxy-manno-octulosonate cytidylyltransferase [Cyanobacteriota bacterium]|nr:3-deoxy-manno-octulosonate cytidylyltransferase [Cyanobacteriota bacterium]
MTNTLIVIPARWGSSRLPGKPLLEIGGQPMIARVVEAARGIAAGLGEEGSQAEVLVATDDQRVATAAEQAGANALLTARHHRSGTERLLEVMERHPAHHYLNLQGDEPLFPPAEGCRLLAALAEGEFHGGAEIISLCHPLPAAEAADPHCVKVVCNQAGEALYFSRAPIPYPHQGNPTYLRHVGVYAYSHAGLERIRRLGPAPLEQWESLEQLRWLEAGERIRLLQCRPLAPGVDTAADLERVRRCWLSGGEQAMAEADPAPVRLAAIQLVISDVDGVLTDGRIYFDATGENLKCFHVRDGLGIRMLESLGVRVTLMSGRDSAPLRQRAASLGLGHCRFGVTNKAAACRDLMADLGLTPEQVAFVGDDSIDLPALEVCGVGFAVADAVAVVRAASDHVLATAGGHGALREVAELLLAARGQQQHLQEAGAFLQVADRISQ